MALLVDPTDVWLLAEDIELFESLVITDAVETIFPMQMMMIMIELYDNINNYNGDNYNDDDNDGDSHDDEDDHHQQQQQHQLCNYLLSIINNII